MRLQPGSDHDRLITLVPFTAVVLLLVPSLWLATTMLPASHVAVEPPKFCGLPDPDAKPRKPLYLRVRIDDDGFHVRTHGEGSGVIPLADASPTGDGEHDYAALEHVAYALVRSYPYESTVTVSAEDAIPLRTLVATLDALRGRDCTIRKPDACLFHRVIVEAGAG